MKTLVIVESPAKAKKIQQYLGNDYIIKSSFGHLTNLKGKGLGVDISNNYNPIYEVVKPKQLKELKDCLKKCDNVILASDNDREGEAISWHLANLLKIDMNKNNRIIFNEITKDAIIKSINDPIKININLVNSQKTRQILDYLVGFKISPILWKHIQPNLSAGRVQSVATKLVIENHNNIINFNQNKYFKTIGNFSNNIISTLNKEFENDENTIKFLKDNINAKYTIESIDKNIVEKKPPPPFITVTLQTEIGRRYNIDSKKIMNILQKLYEAGLITYHRTDSTNLSEKILNDIKKYILDKYSNKYLKLRNYKTKSKTAQEAHEAIRPTDIFMNKLDINYNNIEKKIYELIWQRTLASQMSALVTEVYNMKINISTRQEIFKAKAEKVIFEGYRVIYNEKIKDDDYDSDSEEKISELFSDVKVGTNLNYKNITCTEKLKKPKPRYNESSLIKKMEGLNIGRPSTYASIISTIQERGYVKKETVKGEKYENNIYKLKNDKIIESKGELIIGADKNKLFPTEIGKLTTSFLENNFSNIMNYNFTSDIENNLDLICNGNKNKDIVINDFYKNIEPIINKLKVEVKKNKEKRLLGKIDNLNAYAYVSRYGGCVQIGEDNDKNKKYISIEGKFDVDKVTLKDVLSIETYPKNIGKYENHDILIKNGKYGYYINYNNKNYKFINNYDKDLDINQAIECINNVVKKNLKIGNYEIIVGKYGPYFKHNNKNISIPKKYDINNLTIDIINDLINK